jgi:L-cysteine/cystine lyase
LLTLSHLQRIRQEMPVTNAHIYLNTGTFGPLPSCVVQVMQERLQDEWENGRLGSEAYQNISTIYRSARQAVARLINAEEYEVTLTDNTGEGANIISYGFNWRAGDEVITTNREHIGALAPLYQLRDRFGIVIRFADLGPQANRPVHEAIEELITSRTRLIVLSHVTWMTGKVLDVHAVSLVAHQREIPVLIDGAQAAGNIPVDVRSLDIDFYAIPMQKWLCGPDGTGALYVRRSSLHYVTPTYVGYYSASNEDGTEWVLHSHAQRFELGGRQTAAVAGQRAALEWLETVVGHDWLFERISHLNIYAYHALKDIPGLNILTPIPGACGILSFTLEGRDNNQIVNYLQTEHNIYIRNILYNAKALRISTGFYNTEEEIDQLAQALAQLG